MSSKDITNIVLQSEDPQFPSNLRGGGSLCDCLIGGYGCNVGSFVCQTRGTGCCGTGACCLTWPFICLIGGVWGVVNKATCGCCGLCSN